MDAKYYYKLFGINVESEVFLPEGMTSDEPVDAYIRVANTPKSIVKAGIANEFFQASDDEFVLWVQGVAHYYVSKGNLIVVDPHGGTDDEIRLFLLSSAFAALIHQRGLLPIHASAVAKYGKAFVFAGRSGAGKSTTAANLLVKNFELLADDVCVIVPQKHAVPLLYPGYPQIKLWADALGKLGKNSHDFRKVRENVTKFALPMAGQFYNQAIEIQVIYILQSEPGNTLKIKELQGVEKFKALSANVFRQYLIQGTQQRKRNFERLHTLALQCTVKQIQRPADQLSIDQLILAIEQDIEVLYANKGFCR